MATYTVSSDCDGCDDSYEKNWNPKKGLPYKRRRKAIYELGTLDNPLPNEVNDIWELRQFYSNTEVLRFDGKKYHLVPYAGTYTYSGDSLLAYYEMLNELSPTQSSARVSIKHYCFGGKIDIIRSVDPEFELEQEEDVSVQLKSEFVRNVLKRIQYSGTSWNNLAEKCWESGHRTGNGFLELQLIETAGERTAALHWHKVEYCKYLATPKGEQKFVAISPVWETEFIKANPPDILPIYPASITDERTGVTRTLIHWKNGCNEWYGRPGSSGSALDQYTEFSDTVYRLKEAANNFTPRVIIEAEDDNPEATNQDAIEAGFENEAHRFNHNFTNQGDDPSGVLYTSRPFGAKPISVTQIEPNTNEAWYTEVGALSRQRIIESNSWSARLMKDDSATGLNSSDAKLAALKSMLPIVRKNQAIPEYSINKALEVIIEFFGLTQYQDLKLKFKSPYAEMLEQINEAEEDNTNQIDNGNTNN